MNLTSKHKKEIIGRLDAMPFEQARKEIRNGTFAEIGSEIHAFASSWLLGKEAELRDSESDEAIAIARSALRIARQDRISTIIAIIIAIIAIIISILKN